VFFPVSQYYFSRWEGVFSLSASIIFLGGRVFFPVNQYYFSRFESVFTSGSIIFLGGRESFPRQPVLLF
jgi:hypothetical protein